MSFISGLPLIVWKGGLAGFFKGIAISSVGNPVAMYVRSHLERVPQAAISVAQAGLVVTSAALAYKWSCTGDFETDAGTMLTSLAGSYIGSEMANTWQPQVARRLF